MILAAAHVVAIDPTVKVRAGDAEVRSGRVGQVGQVKVVILPDDLAETAHIGARQGLQVGDWLSAVRDAVGVEMRSGRHRQRLEIAAGAVFAHHFGGASGHAGRGVPARIHGYLIIGIVICDISSVRVGIDDCGGAAKRVRGHQGDQVQARARQRVPAGRQVLEVARDGGIHVIDGFHDGAGDEVIACVAEEAVCILMPDLVAIGIEEADLAVHRARAVLGSSYGRQGNRDRLHLEPWVARVPGIGCMITVTSV